MSRIKQSKIDLCFYIFGLGVCFFIMYLIGSILYEDWNNIDFISHNFWWMVAFSVLILCALFGLIACYVKVSEIFS